MIDPRLAWFSMGAVFSAVLFGWPWHPRFSRYSRRGSNPPSPDRKPPPPPAPPPLAGHARWFINNPVQIAECGGPCTSGPSHCDCGALWLDVPSAAEARRAKFIDPSLGVPWDEGRTQRGNGSGGPTTPKPPIKPQPAGGRLIINARLTGCERTILNTGDG
jgi:hypothetical protein